MFPELIHAWRGLRSRPLFTAAAVLSLAIGIGANSAIFSLVYSILLAPLPYPESERLVVLQESVDGREAGASPQRWKDWAAQTEVLSAVTALYGESMTYTHNDGSERVAAWRTFGDLAATFHLTPFAGRNFTPAELLGEPGAALVSHGYWQRRFGGDSSLIGRRLLLNNRPVTVVGILPPAFDTEQVDAIVPETTQTMGRQARFLFQVGQLAPEMSLAQAQERLTIVAGRLREQYAVADKGLGIAVRSYKETVTGAARTPLTVLLGAIGFVLLSTCLNIASLLLHRSTARRPELAMRLALGASRWNIARLLLAEGLLLGAMGGAGSLFAAMWGIDLMKLVVPADTPRLSEVSLSWPVVAFAAGLALLTAFLCSLAPVLWNSRPELLEAFRSVSRVSGRRHWAQRGLVVVQVGISLTLLIGAGLLMRSFLHLQSRPVGIRPEHLIAFQSPLAWNIPEERVGAVIGGILGELRRIPGVEGAEYTDRLPNGGGAASGPVAIGGRPDAALDGLPEVNSRSVSPGYLRMARVPLLLGRYLEEQDAASGALRTVINETAAALFFPGEDPIGKRIGQRFPPHPTRYFEVVGVAQNVPMNPREKSTPPMLYLDYRQQFWPIGTYVVRTTADVSAVAAAIRQAVARVDQTQVAENLRTVDEFLRRTHAEPRLNAGLSGAFAVAALLLAAIGIYGLLSNMVTERSHELGIRVALGADPASLLRLVFAHALPLIGLGVMAGLGGAWLLRGLLATLLFGLQPEDPGTMLGASLLLLVAAAVACYVPARRALRMDPARVLRQ